HGDDFRAIDWNVSARLAQPFVKTFTEERELTVLLVVDQSGSARFGVPRTKAEVSTEVAAVLALAAARQNDRVGALLFSDRVERVIPPGKGRRHALRVIRDILAFEPAGRRTDLAGALTYAARLLTHRAIVVVLSDFVATGWERPLRRLGLRHEVVAVTVDDPRERALPDAGWIELEDQESGERVLVDSGDPGVRDRLAAAAGKRREARARALRAAGVDELVLATDQDYAPALQRAFARRGRRRR
ncbi:MAG TPA: VWA domain-containing protein, partial [Gemmatimonadales bacterium]|nr:VWA domain-containing protein [Gemmatimonadales bacterium]